MQNINEKIFKSYDIRGIYPTEINEEAAYTIGKAYAHLIRDVKNKPGESLTIVLARDMRLGSPDLYKGLVRGLVESGITIEDIGMMPIDGVYFAAGKYCYDGGIMVTASHNPKEYAGIKMIGPGFSWIRGKDILAYVEKETAAPAPAPGAVREKDITEEYLAHILSFIDIKKLKPLKVVVDAGNGMAGKIVPELFKKLPFALTPLFFELDGSFPNRPSNPLEPGASDAVRKKVVEEKADLGVMMDGDADRMFFIDEKGSFIRADYTLLALAKIMLEKHPGAGIAYSLECSRIVPERVKAWGGVPIKTPVGYVNVSSYMKQGSGVLGGEYSAHYSYKDNYYADSGFISLLLMLELVSETGKPLSEIVKEYDVYYHADMVNLKITNAAEVIAAITNLYSDAEKDTMDGVMVSYPEWWAIVRASNTEPLLRVSIAGVSKEIVEKEQRKLLEAISALAKTP